VSSYRIVQWGTGNVGKHALRTIVERPDFELAGVRVYDPDKVGRDAGELLGIAPVGVVATDDIEAILALDADCVCYTTLGARVERGKPALDDICRLLASGKNVVSSSVEFHAFLGTAVQPRGTDDVYERLSKACAEGQSTYLQQGVNPGFGMDMWPLQLTRLCRRIDHLRATEIVDMRRYTSTFLVRGMGFGLPPGEKSPMDDSLRNADNIGFGLTLRLFADALGVRFDEIKYRREVGVTPEPLEVAAGTIDAGTVAVMKLSLEGIIGGRPVVTFEWVWRLTDEVAPEWPTGESRWVLHIDGDPTLDSEVTLSTDLDAKRATSLAAASLLLNAVPSVCAAPPGLVNWLSLPTHGGGYFLP
jgi:4-hydroxy-tetrahydrodipicolinate reductase